jgi:hypothetical protein
MKSISSEGARPVGRDEATARAVAVALRRGARRRAPRPARARMSKLIAVVADEDTVAGLCLAGVGA